MQRNVRIGIGMLAGAVCFIAPTAFMPLLQWYSSGLSNGIENWLWVPAVLAIPILAPLLCLAILEVCLDRETSMARTLRYAILGMAVLQACFALWHIVRGI